MIEHDVAESEARALMEGIVFGESPRWRDGHVWFCDWGAGEIVAVDLDGASEVIARIGSFPLCIDWLPDGRLVAVSGQERRLLRREADGSLQVHADLAALSPHPWNEVAVHPRGNIFVNNIGFDFAGGQPDAGIIALVAPGGTVRKVAEKLAFPNGMAVTPDGSTLIVAESHGQRLTAFDIARDGGLSNRRVWAELQGGYPDGICLDAEGAVWYADVPNKCCVRVREGGEILRTVNLDRGCFSCALGGADERTLFVTATEWRGPENMFARPPTGQLLAVTL